MGAANRRASHPTDATIFPLLGDVASARCLCTQGVPETTFRTLFVFFNFARNSISPSSLHSVQGENETPLRVVPPVLLSSLSSFATETSSIQNCVEARPRRKRYRPLPMGRQNNAPRNRGINRYRCCWALHLRPKKLSRSPFGCIVEFLDI